MKVTKFKIRGIETIVEFNEDEATASQVHYYYRKCKTLDEFESLGSEWECLNYWDVVPKLFPGEALFDNGDEAQAAWDVLREKLMSLATVVVE